MRIRIEPILPTGILEAIYRQALLPEHIGNPLIEALPPFQCANTMIGFFGKYPPITSQERSMDASHRILAVSRIDNYLEPLTAHFDVIEKINLIVRIGYAFRNPVLPDVMKAKTEFYRQAIEEDKILPIEFSSPSTAPSFSLFGLSGVGKSTVVERTLSFLPQVLLHKQHGFVQVVWMKLDCPQDGNLKQLLLWMIAGFDDLLGTTHMNEVKGRITTDQLILFVAVLAHKYSLGILVFDETQNLLDANGDATTKTMNFFLTFANVVKIPLAFLGTKRASYLFDKQFRNARRAGEHGTFQWDRLKFGEEWTYFLESLWKYQWTAQVTPLTDSLSKLFYDKTQGIHALVVMLFQLSQFQAIRNGSNGGDEALTEDLITQVALDRFKLSEFTLTYLRGYDSTGKKLKNPELKKMGKILEDVFRDDLFDMRKEVENEGKIAKLKANAMENNKIRTERTNAVSALLAIGYEENTVEDAVTSLFEADSTMTAEKALLKILESMKGNADSNDAPDAQSLKSIIKAGIESGKSPQSALTSAGIIAPSSGES